MPSDWAAVDGEKSVGSDVIANGEPQANAEDQKPHPDDVCDAIGKLQ